MKCAYVAADLQDAHIVSSLLEQVGIENRILNTNARSGTGEIPFTHAYPQVWVLNDETFERARTVIRDYEHCVGFKESIFCRGCGEANPGNFMLCWNCGNDLSAV